MMGPILLQVRWGPRADEKLLIAPGQTVRVGRSPEATLSMGQDPDLSALHFELRHEGERLWIADLQSRLGTIADGLPVTAPRAVGDGAFIRAGRTTFTLTEARLPRPREPIPEHRLPPRRAALATIAAEGRLFAVLDAARDTRILELLRASEAPMKSLYEGPEGDAMSEAAPYLVELTAGSPLLERLVLEGWGEAWGIFLSWNAPFREVRRHLRRLLLVSLDGRREPVYFRFYDPRVIGLLWPSLTVAQRSALLGEGMSFFIEGPDLSVNRLSLGPRSGGD